MSENKENLDISKETIITSTLCPECVKDTSGTCINHRVIHIERVVHLPEICNKCKKIKAEKGMFVYGVNCKCGRPTSYTPEILEKANEYLNLTMPHKDTGEIMHSEVGLCLYIGIGKTTCKDWRKDKDKSEFSTIVDDILQKQENNLINGGVSDRYNGTITKLLLTKHGYRDAVDNFNTEMPVDPEGKAKGDSAIKRFLGGKK